MTTRLQCFCHYHICHVYTLTEISVEMETSKEHDVDNVEHEQ